MWRAGENERTKKKPRSRGRRDERRLQVQGGRIPCRGPAPREPGMLAGLPGGCPGQGRGRAGPARRGHREPAPRKLRRPAVPPQSASLAPSVTLSPPGRRCVPPLGSPVGSPAAPDLPPLRADSKACQRGFVRNGGGRTQLTLQTMHKLVSAFPFRSTLKSRFSVSPGGKQAGEERGNCLGKAAAKWVKFRAHPGSSTLQ